MIKRPGYIQLHRRLESICPSMSLPFHQQNSQQLPYLRFFAEENLKFNMLVELKTTTQLIVTSRIIFKDWHLP